MFKNVMKHFAPVAMLLLALLVVPCLATPASAAEVIVSGTCGDALTWELTDDGVLTISGEGAMANYSETSMPWYDYLTAITLIETTLYCLAVGIKLPKKSLQTSSSILKTTN